jgi:hypothetical protein
VNGSGRQIPLQLKRLIATALIISGDPTVFPPAGKADTRVSDAEVGVRSRQPPGPHLGHQLDKPAWSGDHRGAHQILH